MKPSLSITLVELPPTTDGSLCGGISDDVYSLVSLPSRATDLLAAICGKNGFNDVAAINPSFNKAPGRFTPDQLKRLTTCDVVGISAITRTAPQSYELADRIKRMNPDSIIIMGGPHTSALPEEALKHCDIVVMNEGDRTFVELLERIRDGADVGDVSGIAHKGGLTPKRAFLTNDELDALPFPVYSKEVLKGITHTVINTSRGCPYGCDYCAVIENFGRKFRFLSVERTIEHIRHTLAQTGKRIFFGDDNFAASPVRTKRLMEEILRQGLKLPPWLAQVRVESAGDRELLKLMKRANCERVCIGFESADENALRLLNKNATIEKNTLAIERFHEAGISIHGMFIAGADTDTKETLARNVEYARKMRIDTVQFLFITPLPGTKLTRKLAEEGRIITKEWHRYDGHHVLVKPKLLSPVELHEAVNSAWKKFYSISEALRHLVYGNEHWFNFMVRVLGRGMVKKIARDGSYYRRALMSLETWQNQIVREYGAISARLDALAVNISRGIENGYKRTRFSVESRYDSAKHSVGNKYDAARHNMEHQYELAKADLELALKFITDKKREVVEDYFATYKKKILDELESAIRKKLDELESMWQKVPVTA